MNFNLHGPGEDDEIDLPIGRDGANRKISRERWEELWSEVDQMVPGTLVREDEVTSYVAGTMADDEVEFFEKCARENPAFFVDIQQQRAEFQAYFTPEKIFEIQERFLHGVSGALGRQCN